MSATNDDAILEMRHIHKRFSGVPVLHDVSFACRRGTVHALLGENGAGKSTLMKILAGAYQADEGEIVFKGESFTQLSTREALALGIRIIYQELNLLPDMTIAENIFLGAEPRTRLGLVNTQAMVTRSRILLDQLGVALDPRTPVDELTVAGRQMVEIAKALSQSADLVVMDEPSAILAGHELEQLFAIIRALKAQGVSVIYISHRLDEIFQIADAVTVLKDGQVMATVPIDQVTRAQLIQLMVGRPLEEAYPRAKGQRGEPRLMVEGLSTQAEAGRSVRNVSFTLHSGEILGVAGMVGSGRTELACAIFGADPLTAGRITVDGKPLYGHDPNRAIRAGVTLVPEDRKSQGLFLGLSIRHNVTLPILDRLARFGILRRQLERQTVDEVQRRLAIAMRSPDQLVQYLSGGNQQKVVLGRWLETEPHIIILDEPTRGIDVGAKFEIYQLMRRLTEQGVAILMISSELPEILGISDRILVMHNGECVGELNAAEATEEKIIELATTGELREPAMRPAQPV